MSKYNRKQKTPAQDEFLSFWARAFQKVEPYLRFIGFTSLGTLVVLFATWGVSRWLDGRAQSAAELFGRAVKIYDSDLYTGDTAPKSEEQNPIPRFKSDKERADAAIAELDKLDKQFGSSSVATDAQLFRAGVLYDLARYEDAQKAFEKVAASGPRSTAVLVLAREGAALCDEARGKIEEALGKYKVMAPEGKAGDFFRDRALYAQARLYLKKGEKKHAAELLKEITAKTPGTALKDEIASALAQIGDQ